LPAWVIAKEEESSWVMADSSDGEEWTEEAGLGQPTKSVKYAQDAGWGRGGRKLSRASSMTMRRVESRR
jgi:hypothetical protein